MMGRVGSGYLVLLMFVVLAALAASCGEESSEVPEKPKGDAAPTAPATPEPRDEEASEKEEPKNDPGATGRSEENAAAEDREEAAGSDADQYGSSGQYAAAPADPTMYLSVPKLGISGALVIDGEAGLEMGAMHLSGTGYPWLPGSNTYIAGHRVGFPGTGSDHIFYDLPAMAVGDEVVLEDSNGQTYNYAVSEVFAVTPYDTWVTAPTGSDTVTLQVCTETPNDWWTIGPSLMASGPESGRLIVRANRV